MKISKLFSLSHTLAKDYLEQFTYPFEALEGLRDFIYALGKTLDDEYIVWNEGVWVHRTSKIAPSASITPPCIIGRGSELRHCAFLRGSVLVGENCVVGNSTELKNCILFDCVQVPHFNYVGDSILGYKAHLGAGAVTSNVKGDGSEVVLKGQTQSVPTGRKKCGAFLGDYVEIGCNSVLNPGTAVGKNTTAYPLSFLRGEYKENLIVKQNGVAVQKK